MAKIYLFIVAFRNVNKVIFVGQQAVKRADQTERQCSVGHACAFPVLKTSRAGVLSENGSNPFPCLSLDHPFIHLA